MGGWIQSWAVIGSTGNEYKVSTKADGTWGCSCKAWTTARAPKPDCKHIRQKREELENSAAMERVRAVVATFRAPPPLPVVKTSPVVRSTEEAVRELESLERRGRITYAQTKLLRGLRSKLEREQRPGPAAAPDRQKFAPITPARRKIRLDD